MKIFSKARSRVDRPNSPQQKRHSDKGFNAIMADTTHAMPKYNRYFSTFIHSRAVWAVSDALSRIAARPNAILFGAVFSFVFTIGTYLLSKNFGYSLSGSESISAFLVGWLVGIAFDIVSSLRKKK